MSHLEPVHHDKYLFPKPKDGVVYLEFVTERLDLYKEIYGMSIHSLVVQLVLRGLNQYTLVNHYVPKSEKAECSHAIISEFMKLEPASDYAVETLQLLHKYNKGNEEQAIYRILYAYGKNQDRRSLRDQETMAQWILHCDLLKSLGGLVHNDPFRPCLAPAYIILFTDIPIKHIGEWVPEDF